MWGPTELPDGSSAFPVYKRLGVKVLQHQLSWREVATARPANPRDPADPAYRWPAWLDRAVAEGDRNRIRSALMVKRTPDWANGNRGEQWAPTRLRDYADFLAAAARRYRTSATGWSGASRPAATRSSRCRRTRPRGPRLYARMLDQAYVALKGVRRSNKVIGGNTWTVGVVSPAKFVRWMRLPNGKPPRLDWFGHNPFAARRPKLSLRPYDSNVRDMSDVDTLHREVRRAYRGRRTPRLWLSEFTVSARRENRAFTYFVSEQRAGALDHRGVPDRAPEAVRRGPRLVHAARRARGARQPHQRPALRRRQAEARLRAPTAARAERRRARAGPRQRSTFSSRPKRARTSSRPAAPMRGRAGRTPRPALRGSSGGTATPAPARVTSSAASPRADTIAGRPAARHSSSLVGSASANRSRSRSITTPASALANSSGTSAAGTVPSISTFASSRLARASSAASAPPPAIVTWTTFGPGDPRCLDERAEAVREPERARVEHLQRPFLRWRPDGLEALEVHGRGHVHRATGRRRPLLEQPHHALGGHGDGRRVTVGPLLERARCGDRATLRAGRRSRPRCQATGRRR